MTEDSIGRQHRVIGDNHYHDGERLRTGDVFVPSERELAAFGFKFEPVDDDAAADADAASDDAVEASDFDADLWLDADYDQRAEAVRAGEVDDHLDTIAEVDRSENVKDAVDDRRDELEG